MTKKMEILVPTEKGFRENLGNDGNYFGEKLGNERIVRADVRGAGKAVLVALEKWGVLGQGQIEALVFGKEMEAGQRVCLFFDGILKGRHYRSSYKVLKRLEAARLIRLHDFANASLYTLTGRGHTYLVQQGLARIPGFRALIAPGLVPHEVLANGSGLVLSEILGLSVSTEFERQVLSRGSLQKSVRREEFPLPDLWVTDRDQPKAIEMERTQKSAERYQKLWTFYRNNLPSSAVVLYITAFPNGPRILLARARKLLADFIYVCGLDEFLASLGRCPFVGYRDGEIRLEPRADHPQGPHHQRVTTSAPPPQSIRIGELIRPRGRPDQFAAPLEMRPFPHPHPLTPSPTPEGEKSLQGGLR
jgi:hypothetical protein